MIEFALILILLNFAHFLGDYTHLSTGTMLSAKRYGKPLFPILLHAAVHTVLFAIVLMFFTKGVLFSICIWIEFISHFGIDVLKGRLNQRFPAFQDNTDKPHWYLFGADQFAHQLIIIIISFIAAGGIR